MGRLWKILVVGAFLCVLWLGLRDISRSCSVDFVSYSVLSNELASVRSVLSLLANDSERLKSDIVNLTNLVHELEVNYNEKVRNNLAPNNGIVPTNDLKSIRSDQYIRGEYVFTQIGNIKYLTFDGCDFRVGSPCEFGRVVVIDRSFTICIGENGSMTYLLPISDKQSRRASVDPSRASLQAASGHGARPWYYVHTGTEKE